MRSVRPRSRAVFSSLNGQKAVTRFGLYCILHGCALPRAVYSFVRNLFVRPDCWYNLLPHSALLLPMWSLWAPLRHPLVEIYCSPLGPTRDACDRLMNIGHLPPHDTFPPTRLPSTPKEIYCPNPNPTWSRPSPDANNFNQQPYSYVTIATKPIPMHWPDCKSAQ